LQQASVAAQKVVPPVFVPSGATRMKPRSSASWEKCRYWSVWWAFDV
jgi:hypothetical protein